MVQNRYKIWEHAPQPFCWQKLRHGGETIGMHLGPSGNVSQPWTNDQSVDITHWTWLFPMATFTREYLMAGLHPKLQLWGCSLEIIIPLDIVENTTYKPPTRISFCQENMRKWWWTSGFGVPPVLDNVSFYSSVSGSTHGLSMKVSPVISHLLSLSPFLTGPHCAGRHHGGSTGPRSTPLWSKIMKIYDRNPQKSTAVWCHWNMLKFKPPSGSLISSHRATELGQTACRLLGCRCSLQPHHCSQRPVLPNRSARSLSESQVDTWQSHG